MMNTVISLLIPIGIGSLVLMVGMLVSREAEKSVEDSVRECLAWGTGFFVAMSVQVLAIASL